jgi:hypothetical protein
MPDVLALWIDAGNVVDRGEHDVVVDLFLLSSNAWPPPPGMFQRRSKAAFTTTRPAFSEGSRPRQPGFLPATSINYYIDILLHAPVRIIARTRCWDEKIHY